VAFHHFNLAAFLAIASLLSFSGTALAQQDDVDAQFAALAWKLGPTQADLGGIARVVVPTGYRLLGGGDTGRFMELTQNPSHGDELGVLLSDDASWFVVFEFSPEGYVKDDEQLDSDAILSGIKKGTDKANSIRRQRGWPILNILGWNQQPFYDPQTNNLTWSIRASSEGSTVINHSTRLLGRRGVMNVDLVLSPEDVASAVPAFNSLMTKFTFNPGNRYAEFTRGDKVAQYGLTGLIVGGTGVAVVKSGLLQKLGKLIVFGFIALAAAIKKIFGSLMRGPKASDSHSHA